MPEKTGLHPGEMQNSFAAVGCGGTIEDSWALVLPEDLQPDQVYHGARVIVGDEASAQTDVTVLGTELFETTGGAVKVLVISERGGNARD